MTGPGFVNCGVLTVQGGANGFTRGTIALGRRSVLSLGGQRASRARIVRTVRVRCTAAAPGRDLAFRTDAMSVDEEISHMVNTYPLVLFMKGTSTQPKCGFSYQTLEILNSVAGHQLRCVDCLNGRVNPGLREGIKTYSKWPTIPQFYLNGEFIGGCDIVMELAQTGELMEMIEVALA